MKPLVKKSELEGEIGVAARKVARAGATRQGDDLIEANLHVAKLTAGFDPQEADRTSLNYRFGAQRGLSAALNGIWESIPPEIQGTIDPERVAALAALAERKANQPEHVNNANLWAGSPMYFYCEICGHLSDTLPEGYTLRPKHFCDECRDLVKRGWLE